MTGKTVVKTVVTMRNPMIRKLGAVLAVGAVLLAAGCSSSKSGPMPSEGIGPNAPGASTPASGTVAPCGASATSETWPGALPAPGAMPDSATTLAIIQKRGYLIAGVDLNTWLFGYDPSHKNDPQGFDVDIAKQIAKAIFGDSDPKHIQFKVVTLAGAGNGEIPQLNGGNVDVVVRTTTITCARLQQLNFSNPYYLAEQKVLVPKSLPATTSLADLKGRKVCATLNSTAYQKIVATIGTAYGSGNALDCLALLQEGRVDAVSTDDAILRGMMAQDPQVQITSAPSLGDQPYGIVTAKAKLDLAQFVNGVLDQIKANGTWAAIYQADLQVATAPAPPGVPAAYPG